MYHFIVDLPRSVPSQGEAKSGTTYLRPFGHSSIAFNHWSHSQLVQLPQPCHRHRCRNPTVWWRQDNLILTPSGQAAPQVLRLIPIKLTITNPSKPARCSMPDRKAGSPAQAPFNGVPVSQTSDIYNHTSSAPKCSRSLPPQMSDLSNDLTTLSINEKARSLAQNFPPEIIVKIVLELVQIQWDVAWTTACVCRSWRFAALNVTGRLWSHIYIPVRTIPSFLAGRTLPNRRVETWLQRGGPTIPLYLDLRDNSPFVSNAFSDALRTTGAMSRVVWMRLSIYSTEQWRMRTPAPNLRVLWLMAPVGEYRSFVLLSAALQGLFGYQSFQRPSTSLRELHLQGVIIDGPSHVFLQHITHLSLFNYSETNAGIACRLLQGCSANLQTLSVMPADGMFGGVKLPKLHNLAIYPCQSGILKSWANSVTTSWVRHLEAPSLQTLSSSAPPLKSASPRKYQYLKHLRVWLQVVAAGLQQEIKALHRWLNAPGLLTITLVLNYTVDDIHSTRALASPSLFFGQTVQRVTIGLPPSTAATARIKCEHLKGVWAEAGKELVIERWAAEG